MSKVKLKFAVKLYNSLPKTIRERDIDFEIENEIAF